ncbi:hypothetical protein SEA_MAGRITTE_143 [Microbacterium phage Magritte]|nr:hypothetical protein SEA_MAGRITTE_143 [Microbacterium phage Magritte]
MPEECPVCQEPDPILYKGEEGERDAVSCPECGWTTLI